MNSALRSVLWETTKKAQFLHTLSTQKQNINKTTYRCRHALQLVLVASSNSANAFSSKNKFSAAEGSLRTFWFGGLCVLFVRVKLSELPREKFSLWRRELLPKMHTNVWDIFFEKLSQHKMVECRIQMWETVMHLVIAKFDAFGDRTRQTLVTTPFRSPVGSGVCPLLYIWVKPQ